MSDIIKTIEEIYEFTGQTCVLTPQIHADLRVAWKLLEDAGQKAAADRVFRFLETPATMTAPNAEKNCRCRRRSPGDDHKEKMEMKNMSKLPFQNEQDIAEAGKAIRAINPFSSPVIETVRSFAILGKPGVLKARLKDATEWVIDGTNARQLTGEEIAAHKQMVQEYLS